MLYDFQTVATLCMKKNEFAVFLKTFAILALVHGLNLHESKRVLCAKMAEHETPVSRHVEKVVNSCLFPARCCGSTWLHQQRNALSKPDQMPKTAMKARTKVWKTLGTRTVKIQMKK